MRSSSKRWRAAALAATAAVAASAAFAIPASATETGEWGKWSHEVANGQMGQIHIQLQGTISEAHNNGHELESWRGLDNQVWLSFDNGLAFTFGNTSTNVSPAVAAYGSTSFAVFQTGTDGKIYWTTIQPGASSSSYHSVPGQTTNMSVSVTQMGAGSSQLYMSYRGVGNDQRVFGTMWNGSSWVNTHPMAGALSPSAPSITYDNGKLFDTVRGEDNQVYLIASFNGGLTWPNAAVPEGGVTFDSPRIAASPADGNLLISHRGTDDKIYYRTFNSFGEPTGNWSGDITGWQTHNPIELVSIGNAIFAVVTGNDTFGYFKQVINPS